MRTIIKKISADHFCEVLREMAEEITAHSGKIVDASLQAVGEKNDELIIAFAYEIVTDPIPIIFTPISEPAFQKTELVSSSYPVFVMAGENKQDLYGFYFR